MMLVGFVPVEWELDVNQFRSVPVEINSQHTVALREKIRHWELAEQGVWWKVCLHEVNVFIAQLEPLQPSLTASTWQGVSDPVMATFTADSHNPIQCATTG